jgi:hypothetical protein
MSLNCGKKTLRLKALYLDFIRYHGMKAYSCFPEMLIVLKHLPEVPVEKSTNN